MGGASDRGTYPVIGDSVRIYSATQIVSGKMRKKASVVEAFNLSFGSHAALHPATHGSHLVPLERSQAFKVELKP